MSTAAVAPVSRVLANPRRTRLVVMPAPHGHDAMTGSSPRGEGDATRSDSKS